MLAAVWCSRGGFAHTYEALFGCPLLVHFLVTFLAMSSLSLARCGLPLARASTSSSSSRKIKAVRHLKRWVAGGRRWGGGQKI